MTKGKTHEYRSFESGRKLFQDRDDDIHIIPSGKVAENNSGGTVKEVRFTEFGQFLTHFVGLAENAFDENDPAFDIHFVSGTRNFDETAHKTGESLAGTISGDDGSKFERPDFFPVIHISHVRNDAWVERNQRTEIRAGDRSAVSPRIQSAQYHGDGTVTLQIKFRPFVQF